MDLGMQNRKEVACSKVASQRVARVGHTTVEF
jgi:hypothetical protein